MLSRFLDWIDETAGGFIRLAYLVAGITAVAVYFGAGHLPAGVKDVLDAEQPWSLAFAVETHTYITARRVRHAWQDMQSATKDGPEWLRARGSLRVNVGILAALLAFQVWNQLNYLYQTWTPPATALALPGWSAYVVRALVIPVAFMCAAFLAPIAAPIAAQVETEARATLADVFKIARRQRRKLLKSAEKAGRDMTGALVELVEDPAARRIISHAYATIREPVPALLPAPADADTIPYYAPHPASPLQPIDEAQAEGLRNPPPGPQGGARKPRKPRSGAAIRLVPESAALRKPIGQSVEPQARAAWFAAPLPPPPPTGEPPKPRLSIPALQRNADISRSSSIKYRAQFFAEDNPTAPPLEEIEAPAAKLAS